jgi:hypothetical protein
MAHIVASSSNWTRGDVAADPARLNKYENLILLCPNHHQEIDAPASTYSVEDLIEMKRAHEARIASQLGRGEVWNEELGSIDYLNIPRLLLDPAAQEAIRDSAPPVSLETQTLRGLGPAMGPIMLAFERVFSSWRAQALPLSVIEEFGGQAVGSRVAFEASFFTKGMTGAEKMKPGYELTGDLEKDPRIYRKQGGRRLVLPLDPRWVTASTAFHDFTSGRGKFAGLGLLKRVTATQAVISPLVVGKPPLAEWVKEFYQGASS